MAIVETVIAQLDTIFSYILVSQMLELNWNSQEYIEKSELPWLLAW